MAYTNVSKTSTIWTTIKSFVRPGVYGLAFFGRSRYGRGSVASAQEYTNVSKSSTSFTNTPRNS